MLRCLLLGLLLVLGCQLAHTPANTGPTGPGTFTGGGCKSTTVYHLDSRFTAAEVATVHQAMDMWFVGTGGRACFVANYPHYSLVIVRADSQQDLLPWRPEVSGVLGLTWRDNMILVAGILAQSELLAVAVHELGHVVGLEHESNPNVVSFMHPAGPMPLGLVALPPADVHAFCLAFGCEASLR